MISALLAALLLANAIVERTKSLPENWVWIGLLAALAAVYWFPFDHMDASPRVVGTIAVGLFSIPVLFAGVLFSCEFRKVLSPSSALNANVLGAVAGGFTGNSPPPLGRGFAVSWLLLQNPKSFPLASGAATSI